MTDTMIARQRAVDCVLRAADAYKAQGDERIAAVLRGVGGAVGAIEPDRQRPLTLDQLKRLPDGMLVWKEEKCANLSSFHQAYGTLLALVYDGEGKKRRYGKIARAWRRIPTEEELAAAEWEV